MPRTIFIYTLTKANIMDIRQTIRKYALQNAVKFEGKASIGAVIGKVLSEMPELKAKIKEISKDVKSVVDDVNKLKVDAQFAELKRTAPELLEEKKHERKHELPPLKNQKNL